jgi:hypothetical protein
MTLISDALDARDGIVESAETYRIPRDHPRGSMIVCILPVSNPVQRFMPQYRDQLVQILHSWTLDVQTVFGLKMGNALWATCIMIPIDLEFGSLANRSFQCNFRRFQMR